jgi:hypothetical protein
MRVGVPEMARFPLDTDEDPAPTPPKVEREKNRGFGDEDAPEHLEEADELDNDDGDMADEGRARRR